MTVQEIEYRGWFGRFTEPRSAKVGREREAKHIALWNWSPRGMQDRGLTAGREQQRAYGDLQAAFAASDWQR
jgi:hypothetical protein